MAATSATASTPATPSGAQSGAPSAVLSHPSWALAMGQVAAHADLVSAPTLAASVIATRDPDAIATLLARKESTGETMLAAVRALLRPREDLPHLICQVLSARTDRTPQVEQYLAANLKAGLGLFKDNPFTDPTAIASLIRRALPQKLPKEYQFAGALRTCGEVQEALEGVLGAEESNDLVLATNFLPRALACVKRTYLSRAGTHDGALVGKVLAATLEFGARNKTELAAALQEVFGTQVPGRIWRYLATEQVLGGPELAWVREQALRDLAADLSPSAPQGQTAMSVLAIAKARDDFDAEQWERAQELVADYARTASTMNALTRKHVRNILAGSAAGDEAGEGPARSVYATGLLEDAIAAGEKVGWALTDEQSQEMLARRDVSSDLAATICERPFATPKDVAWMMRARPFDRDFLAWLLRRWPERAMAQFLRAHGPLAVLDREMPLRVREEMVAQATVGAITDTGVHFTNLSSDSGIWDEVAAAGDLLPESVLGELPAWVLLAWSPWELRVGKVVADALAGACADLEAQDALAALLTGAVEQHSPSSLSQLAAAALGCSA